MAPASRSSTGRPVQNGIQVRCCSERSWSTGQAEPSPWPAGAAGTRDGDGETVPAGAPRAAGCLPLPRGAGTPRASRGVPPDRAGARRSRRTHLCPAAHRCRTRSVCPAAGRAAGAAPPARPGSPGARAASRAGWQPLPPVTASRGGPARDWQRGQPRHHRPPPRTYRRRRRGAAQPLPDRKSVV